MKNFLPNKKTHALVIGGLVTIAGLFMTGELALGEAVQRALEVLAISALRIGVENAKQA